MFSRSKKSPEEDSLGSRSDLDEEETVPLFEDEGRDQITPLRTHAANNKNNKVRSQHQNVNYANNSHNRPKRGISLFRSNCPDEMAESFRRDRDLLRAENDVYDEKVRKAWKINFNPYHKDGCGFFVAAIVLAIFSISVGVLSIVFRKDFFGYLSAIVFLASLMCVVFWYTFSLEVHSPKKFTGYYTIGHRPKELGGSGPPGGQSNGNKNLLDVQKRREIKDHLTAGKSVHVEGVGTYV